MTGPYQIMPFGGGATTQSGDCLPPEVDVDCKSQWKTLHGFVLPDTWLLSTTLQLQLWKAANAQSPSVETMLMENLRLLSQKSRASGTLLNVVPGRSL